MEMERFLKMFKNESIYIKEQEFNEEDWEYELKFLIAIDNGFNEEEFVFEDVDMHGLSDFLKEIFNLMLRFRLEVE